MSGSLKTNGLSQIGAGDRLPPSRISLIVNEKRGITADTAARDLDDTLARRRNAG